MHEGISDNDLRWWALPYTVDYLITHHFAAEWPRRDNGEEWGFMGYEEAELPENCRMSHEGMQPEDGSATLWLYRFPRYDMWNRNQLSCETVNLLGDVIRNGRSSRSFTSYERKAWENVQQAGFAHEESDGSIVMDIAVIDENRKRAVRDIIQSHPLYGKLLASLQETYDRVEEILSRNNSPVLKEQFPCCVSGEMFDIRAMAVYDEVDGGRLTVPENKGRSMAARYLELNT